MVEPLSGTQESLGSIPIMRKGKWREEEEAGSSNNNQQFHEYMVGLKMNQDRAFDQEISEALENLPGELTDCIWIVI